MTVPLLALFLLCCYWPFHSLLAPRWPINLVGTVNSLEDALLSSSVAGLVAGINKHGHPSVAASIAY